MEEKITLRKPKPDELGIRQHWMADEATMSYNRGFEPFEGYDPATGCITFPEKDWEAWYKTWVCGEPDRYYAYIIREKDEQILGEVCLHSSGDSGTYEMGILLEARFRRQGYAGPALRLLLEEAFGRLCANKVVNRFGLEREAAVRLHLAAGFYLLPDGDGILFMMDRERFESTQRRTCAAGAAEKEE